MIGRESVGDEAVIAVVEVGDGDRGACLDGSEDLGFDGAKEICEEKKR